MIDRHIVILAMPLCMAIPAAQSLASQVALEIEAQSAAGSGSFVVTLDETSHDPESGTYTWSGGDIALGGDGVAGDVVATISSLSLLLGESDPQVTLFFSLEAGSADTDVTITSSFQSFPPLEPAQGLASVGMTLTDGNGDGAVLGGLHPGGGSYTALLNGLPGETFLEAIEGLTAGSGSTDVDDLSFPGGGAFTPIAGPVSGLASQFAFSVSAGDLVSGSSNFLVQVIPLPAPLALGLAGLVTVVVGRRKERGPERG